METNTRRSRRRSLGMLALAGMLVVAAGVAHASHYRSGHVTWVTDPADPSGLSVNFTVQNSWRRDAYTTANDRCLDPTQNPPAAVACTGPGGAAGVGDVIHERQAQNESTLDPGDGSPPIGSPVTIDGSDSFLYLVTSIDAVENWLFAVALDPATFPAPAGCGGGTVPSTCDTSIGHTYPSADTYQAEMRDCCRIEACEAPNAHINNPENGFRATTTVEVGTGNSSPVSSMPPIILCPADDLCIFRIPTSDNELDVRSFRLATDSEADFDAIGSSTGPGLGQPGATAGCSDPLNADAAIDATTGIYTWNTTGCRRAGDPLGPPPDGGCADPSLNTLYSTQVMVEEQGSGVAVPLDFLIQITPCPFPGNVLPSFDSPPTPLCGSALSAVPGSPVGFTVQASDANAVDVPQLNVAGLPSGAMMVPGLPVLGAPVSSVFSWTPTAAQKGQHVVTFTAQDACSTALCAITIDVSDEICDDGVDNDGDGLADCADPDCDATPCDDGVACTEDDACTGGVCAGSAVDCSSLDNPCGAGVCDPGTGSCELQSFGDGTPCDDDDLCTGNDACTGGACGGVPTDCSAAGGQCSVGVCNPASGACEPEPANEGDPCDLDTDLCTVDECAAGACTNVGTLPPDTCQEGVPIFGCEGVPEARIFPAYIRPLVLIDVAKFATQGFDRWVTRGQLIVPDSSFDPDSQPSWFVLSQSTVQYLAMLGPGVFEQRGSDLHRIWKFKIRNKLPDIPSAPAWRLGRFASSRPDLASGALNRVRYRLKGQGTLIPVDPSFLVNSLGQLRLRQTIRVGDLCFTSVNTCIQSGSKRLRCFSQTAGDVPP